MLFLQVPAAGLLQVPGQGPGLQAGVSFPQEPCLQAPGQPGLVEQGGGLGLQEVPVPAQKGRGLPRPLDEPGVQLLQQGEHLPAQPVAGKIASEVGAVRHIGKAFFGAVGFDLPAVHPQKGAQHLPPPGRDAAQPGKPRPPAQVQEHGLRVVLGVVGGEDAIRLPRGQGVEKLVPHLAAAGLQAHAPLPGEGPHVRPQQGEPDPQLPGEGLRRGLVPLRLLPPEQVVHMGQHHTPGADLFTQPMGQGGGVRPAGKAHHRQALRRQAGEVGGGKILTHRGSPRGR